MSGIGRSVTVQRPFQFRAKCTATPVIRSPGFDARRIDDASLKHAAVCLILADDGAGDCALLITRRASHLNAPAGQFALPGGRVDAGESAIDAALREAREEINLELAPRGRCPLW